MKQLEIDLIAKAVRNNEDLTQQQKESVLNDIAQYQLRYNDQFFNSRRLLSIGANTLKED